MFKIRLKTWINVCNAYRALPNGVKKASLQWFPFTKLSDVEWDYLSSEAFYRSYIENGAFVLVKKALHSSENYIQKSDGGFRDAKLVSPLLYLILQAVGYEIANVYISERYECISTYYSGRYEDDLTVRYKSEYDSFFKEINSYQETYSYYIKTDITSFFSNINIDKLIERIDDVCNAERPVFSQNQLQLYKKLLEYVGAGRFPLVENSIMSSYLATVIYLDQIDCDLYDFIDQKIGSVTSFKMIRYVDDLYILLSPRNGGEDVKKAYIEIRNEYSSLLKLWGLSLNSRKCKLGSTREINQELKKSLYDEFYCDEKHNIQELYYGSLAEFLEKIIQIIDEGCLDVEQYNDLIDDHFSFDDIEFTASEVFNYFVYESDTEARSNNVSNLILKIIRKNISVISLDPKRLGVLIMKTHNDEAIKATLNELFKRERAGKWNSYDTTIAIAYLVQSEFRHIDLLGVLKKNAPGLYRYYEKYCKISFLRPYMTNGLKTTKTLCRAIGNDWKSYYLYFMYYTEKAKNNNLTAYAFFKNYFDRVTADFDYVNKLYEGNAEKHPNYKGFYAMGVFCKFYSCIEGSKEIIERAHKLRNENPVSHSSASLIENDSTTEDLYETIEDLDSLLCRYITQEDMGLKTQLL